MSGKQHGAVKDFTIATRRGWEAIVPQTPFKATLSNGKILEIEAIIAHEDSPFISLDWKLNGIAPEMPIIVDMRVQRDDPRIAEDVYDACDKFVDKIHAYAGEYIQFKKNEKYQERTDKPKIVYE